MKVATRITAATAVVVALACAAYAFFDLRSRNAERRMMLEREARAVASTLRMTLEPQVSAFRAPSDAQLDGMSRATGWLVRVFPSHASEAVNARERVWLGQLLDMPSARFSELDHGTFAYGLALRAAGPAGEEPKAVALLEIAKTDDVLETTPDDLVRAAVLVGLIALVTTLVVGLLASRLVSRPITKLLRGIDDVAKGDLSHVILSERDDEIGQIATRFNEMTGSLRESRGETQRQNEAKLALEQRLGQTEKLATIGQLAAEIAHEVGTPLNVIAGRARAIQKKASEHPETVEKNAEIIAEQTARITRIIQRLLDFTRRKVGGAGKAEVNLNELALTTMELLSGQFSSAKVKTRLERSEGLPRIAGDADRLQQVMINLLLNAVQAMPDGGALTVDTRAVRRTRPGLEEEQKFVCFSVKDTGIGIPEDIRDKIFDPFYTTKEGRGGTGLGLAVCSGIVKEHDGWIDVEGNEPSGTIFRVYLPA